MSFIKKLPDNVLVYATDGRKFHINLNERIYRSLYFLGVYEPNENKILSRIIRPGNIVTDIGANFGWYTTLFAKFSRQMTCPH